MYPAVTHVVVIFELPTNTPQLTHSCLDRNTALVLIALRSAIKSDLLNPRPPIGDNDPAPDERVIASPPQAPDASDGLNANQALKGRLARASRRSPLQ